MAAQDGYELDFTRLTVTQMDKIAKLTTGQPEFIEALRPAVVGSPYGVDVHAEGWRDQLNVVQMAAIGRRFLTEYQAVFQNN